MQCCYKSNCQKCEHPGDWCNKDAANCKDCGGVELCTEEQVTQEKEKQEKEHNSSHQEHTDNGLRCCYGTNCSDCQSGPNWCNKGAATCKDCGGKDLCTAEQAAQQ